MVSKHLQIWIFLLASQINDKSNNFIFHFPKFIHENPVDFTCLKNLEITEKLCFKITYSKKGMAEVFLKCTVP